MARQTAYARRWCNFTSEANASPLPACAAMTSDRSSALLDSSGIRAWAEAAAVTARLTAPNSNCSNVRAPSNVDQTARRRRPVQLPFTRALRSLEVDRHAVVEPGSALELPA